MPRVVLACALAAAFPAAAVAAVPGAEELRAAPLLEGSGLDLPDTSAVPSGEDIGRAADELVGGVEQASGVDLPAAGPGSNPEPSPAQPGSPPGEAPASSPPAGSGAQAGGSPGPAAQSPGAQRSGRDAPSARGGSDGGSSGRGPRSGRGPEPASAQSATEPARGESSPIGRAFEVVSEIPWPLFAVLLVLAVVGVIMAARSALMARLAQRLRLRGAELEEDVGALQRALLPEVPERIGDVEISVAFRAATGPAAGGDFHDVLDLGAGRVGLLVGDVSGHGRGALDVTALVHYTVRAYLEAGLEPRQALRLADQAVGGKLGGEFATVLAAVYDPSSSKLTYATSGHPVPILLGDAEEHAVELLTPAPIGVGPTTGSRQTSIEVPAGSRLCFITDGLVEARGDDGEMLQRAGLRSFLAELGEGASAEEMLHAVEEQAETPDDLTICVLTPHAAQGSAAVSEEIELEDPSRTDGRFGDFLLACGVPAARVDAAETEVAGLDTGPVVIRVERDADGADWELIVAPRRSDHPLGAPAAATA